MEFFPETDINPVQAEAIARGLFAVARADGAVHPIELTLIQGFYNDTVGGSPSQLASLERGIDIEPALLATAISSPQVAQLFVKTALLVAYADNGCSPAERGVIGRYADELGVTGEEVAHLDQAVKEFLVGQLAHLSNVDAAVEVARKLGV